MDKVIATRYGVDQHKQYVVYCHTQLSTGLKYIGTTKNIANRWHAVRYHTIKIKQAIENDATANNITEEEAFATLFSHEILFEDDNPSQIGMLEAYYTGKFDTLDNGLNGGIGGELFYQTMLKEFSSSNQDRIQEEISKGVNKALAEQTKQAEVLSNVCYSNLTLFQRILSLLKISQHIWISPKTSVTKAEYSSFMSSHIQPILAKTGPVPGLYGKTVYVHFRPRAAGTYAKATFVNDIIPRLQSRFGKVANLKFIEEI